MSSPADQTSAQRRVLADPWVERSVGPLPRHDRLHEEQPESGLLWVLAGKVVVEHGGRVREVRPGTVVSYRLGPALSWRAIEGALVRWSGRPVKLEAGEVASWTANLAMEVPAEPEPAPRRRGIYATAAIAVTWIVALTVAWCYHQAQADHEQQVVRTPASAPVAGALSTGERTLRAHEAEAIFAQAGHVQATARVPGGKPHSVHVHVLVPEEDEIPTQAFQEAADAALARWPDFRVVRVVLVDGSTPWAQVAYERGSHAAADFRDGR